MPRNVYFSQGTSGEQNLYEDITIEGLQIYGHEAFYIPRKIVNEDSIFNEDQLSEFGSSYMIEAYVQNEGGYEGEGDLLSKFGLEIKDQITLVIANRRWEQLIGRHIKADPNLDRKVVRRPMEGDLIYLPFVKGLFEITFVEAEDPFYQLQNLPTFQLKCELFQYGGEEIDTGVSDIDGYETKFAQRDTLYLESPNNGGRFQIGEKVYQSITDPSLKEGSTITTSFRTQKRKIFAEVASWESPNNQTNAEAKLEIYGRTFDSPNAEPNSTLTITDVSQGTSGIYSFNTSPNVDFQIRSSVDSPQFIIGMTSGAQYSLRRLNTTSEDFADMKDTDPLSDNSEFETVGNNFIDFSVANPFGLPNV
jgi:hypothetical protein